MKQLFGILLLAHFIIFPSIVAEQHSNLRIVGGKIARKKTRRHLVLLELELNDGTTSSCTGSIYKREWILTAAHCVEGIDVSSSYAYISPKSTSPSGKSPYFFQTAYIHRRYKSSNPALRNDIAMIKLQRRIGQSQYFPIKVGKPPKEEKKVYAAGYGVLNENGKPADYAMETELLAQDFETCKEFESNSLHRHLSERTHVCATSVGFPDKGKTDTCCKYSKSFNEMQSTSCYEWSSISV